VRRLLFLVAVFLLLITACGASLSPAVEVNSDEVSRSDLLEQASVLAEPLGFGTGNTASSEFVGQLITVRINELLLIQAAADLGVEITEDHEEEAASAIANSNEGQFSGDPDGLTVLVEVLMPSVSAQLALQEVMDPNQALADGYASADIWVDPRFGTWDPERGQVIPPVGPETE